MSLSVFCASPDWTLCKMWNGIFVWDCTGHVHIVSGWNLEFCWGAHTTRFLSCVGFGDRLLSEVKKLAPKDVKIRVRHFSVTNTSFVFVTYQVCWSVTLKEPHSDCSCHLLQMPFLRHSHAQKHLLLWWKSVWFHHWEGGSSDMTPVQDSGPEWLFWGDCQESFCWERSHLCQVLAGVKCGQCAKRSRLELGEVQTDSLFLPDIGSSGEIVFHVDWVCMCCTATHFAVGLGWGGTAQWLSCCYPS